MNKLPGKQKGFTLIEAVVATSVFAFVVSAVLGVYISITQLDSKTRSQRAVTQNARYIMEYLGKEIRNGTVNYAAYPGQNANNTETNAYIINQAGESERFYISGTDLKLEKAAGTTNLNSSSVRVTNFKVLVGPSTTPFTVAASPTVNEQPRVTIIMELTSNIGNRGTDQAKIDLQSTFAVRVYPSRKP